MEPGAKCICSEHELYNAFGDKTEALYRGMRLTVLDSMYVGGMKFYAFDETPKGTWYFYDAFTPLRNLN